MGAARDLDEALLGASIGASLHAWVTRAAMASGEAPSARGRGDRAPRLRRGTGTTMPVGGEPSAIAGAAEGRGGGGDDPEDGAVTEPEALGRIGAARAHRLDLAVLRGDSGEHLGAGTTSA